LARVIIAATAVALCTLGLSVAAGQAAWAADPPTVTSIGTGSGIDIGGTSVNIFGTGFTNATEVDFDTTSTSFTVVSDTQIKAISPAHADGTVDITVTTPDGTSAVTPDDQFTFLREQTIRTISPTSGPVGGGGTMTITGAGFTGTFFVVFRQFVGSQSHSTFASFTVDSDTQITAIIPPAPGGVPGTAGVTVVSPIAPDPTTGIPFYHYVNAPVPTVNGVSPGSGPTAGGNTVTITGTGFTGATAVSFGTVPATSFTVNSDTSITATVPAGTVGIVDVTATTPGGTTATSAADQYAYLPVPAVTGVSPGSGPSVGGNTVTVTGTGFTDASAVTFGAAAATSFTVNSDTSITATVPAGAVGIVDVTVATPGGTSPTSAADQYVYHPTCTTTITGNHSTQLTVSSGLTCLVNATQNGQVTVEPGAALSVTNSAVNGAVTATSPSSITYCGSTENGGLTVTGATGPVTLGGTLPDGACAADTIPSSITITGATAPVTVTGLSQNGTLTLDNDTAGVTLNGSQLNGRAHVENNTATAPAAITVSGNTVTGSLYCTGNNPPPVDNGSINTVSGTATDQCAAIAQR
jgi:hypothetical protein